MASPSTLSLNRLPEYVSRAEALSAEIARINADLHDDSVTTSVPISKRRVDK